MRPAPPRPGTLVASVWADDQCTQRPVVGESYNTLFLKLHKSFGFGDGKEYEGQLTVGTPKDAYPNDPYSIVLYGDFLSEEFNNPFQDNQVIQLEASTDLEIRDYYIFDFYE